MHETIPSAVSSGNELLNSLRLGTADIHRTLDERVSSGSIVSLGGYVRFLTMHARILPDAELWLSRQPDFDAMPDSRARLRASELRRDFQLLGIDMPAPQNMSFLNETASVAGICYVLEGSRLGGAYLTRLLSLNGSSHPIHFLSHGREQHLWPTFLAWLSAREMSPASIGKATAAARNMFGAYLSALE